jgi:hypothetical protein
MLYSTTARLSTMDGKDTLRARRNVIHGTRYTDCPTLQRFSHISLFRLFNTLVSFSFFLSFYLSHTQLGFSLYPYTQPCSLIPSFLINLGNPYTIFHISLLNSSLFFYLRYTEIVCFLCRVYRSLRWQLHLGGHCACSCIYPTPNFSIVRH